MTGKAKEELPLSERRAGQANDLDAVDTLPPSETDVRVEVASGRREDAGVISTIGDRDGRVVQVLADGGRVRNVDLADNQ